MFSLNSSHMIHAYHQFDSVQLRAFVQQRPSSILQIIVRNYLLCSTIDRDIDHGGSQFLCLQRRIQRVRHYSHDGHQHTVRADDTPWSRKICCKGVWTRRLELTELNLNFVLEPLVSKPQKGEGNKNWRRCERTRLNMSRIVEKQMLLLQFTTHCMTTNIQEPELLPFL